MTQPEDTDWLLLNQETATIPWTALQRFFAQGSVIWLRSELDLVETALAMSRDEVTTLEAEIARGGIAPVSDDQARHWLATDAALWAVVVKPWILVQEQR